MIIANDPFMKCKRLMDDFAPRSSLASQTAISGRSERTIDLCLPARFNPGVRIHQAIEGRRTGGLLPPLEKRIES